MTNSPLTASIHILDNDSLLNVFYLYRPFLLGEEDDPDSRLLGGARGWARGRWWYKLAHVCQRWRNVVLGSASYLGISLVCTDGTPVADMLTHSPPLPLDIDYYPGADIAGEDEEGAIIALKKYDRVRRVRLRMRATSLQKLIVVMGDEYPILEYLIIWHPVEGNSTFLTFPGTFQAPHLRHLALLSFALPTGSRLLTNAVGLVTLSLIIVHPSTYFYPDTLLQWLSSMPQLKTLLISFLYPDPDDDDDDEEGQLMQMPIILPNLHSFTFLGVGTYFEALVYHITAPRLENLQLEFFDRPTFSIPRPPQFVSTTNLRFNTAKFKFNDNKVDVSVYPHGEAETYALSIMVHCRHLDWQVSSAAQVFGLLGPMFSAVEHLTLEHRVYNQSSEEHEADYTEWRKLLSSFRNAKTLHVAEGLVEELSRYLQPDDGEPSLETLPELQELTYSGSGNSGGAFTSFINARQNAGRPITLIRS
jgi:hypothetical protein